MDETSTTVDLSEVISTLTSNHDALVALLNGRFDDVSTLLANLAALGMYQLMIQVITLGVILITVFVIGARRQ